MTCHLDREPCYCHSYGARLLASRSPPRCSVCVEWAADAREYLLGLRPSDLAELKVAMRATSETRWPAQSDRLRRVCGSIRVVNALAALGWIRLWPKGWMLTDAGERVQESA